MLMTRVPTATAMTATQSDPSEAKETLRTSSPVTHPEHALRRQA